MAHSSKPLDVRFTTFFDESKIIHEARFKDGFGTLIVYRSDNLDFLFDAIKDMYFPLEPREV